MTLSENQVRHFYVLSQNVAPVEGKKLSEVLVEPGQFMVKVTPDQEHLYIQHVNALKEITRTDLIPVKNILFAKATAPEDMAKKLKTATIKLNKEIDGKPDTNDETAIPKGTYIVRISIRNYVGMSDEDFYFKYGQVTSNGTLEPANFLKKMAKSIEANLSREAAKLFDVKLDDEENPTAIVLTEAKQNWRRGLMARTQVDFTVELVCNDEMFEVEKDGAVTTYDWGTVEMGVSDEPLGNGKDVADMEYFYMGERADLYRGKGWPLNIQTEYMVNPDEDYYLFDLHFAYVGANECVQKSEKTITFASTKKDAIDALVDTFKEYVPVKESKNFSTPAQDDVTEP